MSKPLALFTEGQELADRGGIAVVGDEREMACSCLSVPIWGLVFVVRGIDKVFRVGARTQEEAGVLAENAS